MNPVTRRLRIFLLVLLALHGVVLVRVFALQIIDGGEWAERAERQMFQIRRLMPHRGSIMDRHGRVLASEEPGYHVTVLPRYLDARVWRCTDCLRTVTLGKKTLPVRCRGCGAPGSVFIELTVPLPERYDVIARLLEITPADVEARIRETIAEYEKRKEKGSLREPNPVFKDVPLEVAREVHLHEERTPELRVTLVRLRYMHHPTHLPHVLGVAGPAWKEDRERLDLLGFTYRDSFRLTVGHSGLERLLEERLIGRMGEQRVLVDHAGVVLDVPWDEPPRDGEDVRLTIDLELQRVAEQALDRAGLPGAFVALDPRNGEIIALATAPRFNLATMSEEYDRLLKDEDKPFINRAIKTSTVPGSVFKVVTAIAALEQGAADLSTEIVCSGAFVRGDTRIECNARHGRVGLLGATERSCNVFFIEVGARLGLRALEEACRRLGLGGPSGSELAEASGSVPTAGPNEVQNRRNVRMVSFGQGRIAVTPLQMARITALIANGGRLVRPTILLGHADAPGRPIVKVSVLEPVREGMRRVVHGSRGTASKYGLQQHRVAAKTGTGERGRGQLNNGWLIGYAPYDNPRIAFACYIENTPEHGGTVCGPIVKQWLDAWEARR